MKGGKGEIEREKGISDLFIYIHYMKLHLHHTKFIISHAQIHQI